MRYSFLLPLPNFLNLAKTLKDVPPRDATVMLLIYGADLTPLPTTNVPSEGYLDMKVSGSL